MSAIQFTTVIGPDGVIRPPAGVSLPEGKIEVTVRPQPTTSEEHEDRLRRLCTRHGLDPDTLDDVTRSILLDELDYEDRGTVRLRLGPGAFKGVITYMAPDFDAPLKDMKEYME